MHVHIILNYCPPLPVLVPFLLYPIHSASPPFQDASPGKCCMERGHPYHLAAFLIQHLSTMKLRILASQTSWKLASLGIRIRRLANSPAFVMLIVSMLKYGRRHTLSDVEDYAGSCHCFVSAPESVLESALQSALVLRLGLGLGLFDGNLLFSRPQLTCL